MIVSWLFVPGIYSLLVHDIESSSNPQKMTPRVPVNFTSNVTGLQDNDSQRGSIMSITCAPCVIVIDWIYIKPHAINKSMNQLTFDTNIAVEWRTSTTYMNEVGENV